MNVDMSRIESTSMGVNAPHVKLEDVDFYDDSNETGLVKAPPPPTIRSRTPDSPPIKRYWVVMRYELMFLKIIQEATII